MKQIRGKTCRALARDIEKYLDIHYKDRLCLDELSERFYISRYYLAHLFKEEAGVPIMKYVMYRRIVDAREKLANSSESIQEISDQLGFSTSRQLTLMFKKYCGVTPTAYRRQYDGRPLEKKGTDVIKIRSGRERKRELSHFSGQEDTKNSQFLLALTIDEC